MTDSPAALIGLRHSNANGVGVGYAGARLELAQAVELRRLRWRHALQGIRHLQRPAGLGPHRCHAHSGIDGGELQLAAVRSGAQYAVVADHRLRARTGTAAAAARAATLEKAAGGAKVQPRHEAARRLRHHDEHLARVRHDVRRAAGAWQAHLGVRILADDGGVEIAEAVDLRSAEEADVYAAALQ